MPSKRKMSSITRSGATKRATFRTVRRGRRVVKKHLKPRLGQGTVYRYTRYATDPLDIDLNSTSQAYGSEFALQNVKSYSEFSSLYDSFMITGVQMRIQLITNPSAAFTNNNTPATALANPSNWYPKIWYINDTDDSVAVSLSQMRERQGVKCKVLKPDKALTMFVRPAIAVQTYRTLTTTGFAPKRMYLDMATGYNVPHYGFKYVFDTNGLDPNDTYPFKIRIEYKYYLKFKGVI